MAEKVYKIWDSESQRYLGTRKKNMWSKRGHAQAAVWCTESYDVGQEYLSHIEIHEFDLIHSDTFQMIDLIDKRTLQRLK